MAPESLARSSDPAAAAKTEAPKASERSPRAERRMPSAREAMATLPEIEGDDFDFEPHDTIPAPTWLDDEIAAPPKAP
jgi:hypothetical protein